MESLLIRLISSIIPNCSRDEAILATHSKGRSVTRARRLSENFESCIFYTLYLVTYIDYQHYILCYSLF